jgi:hypothetical protein
MFIVIQKPNSNKVFLSYLIPAIAANYILRTTNFRSTFQIQGMYIHNLRSVRMCELRISFVPHKKLATFSEKLYLTVEQLDIMSIYTLCILGVIFKPMSE